MKQMSRIFSILLVLLLMVGIAPNARASGGTVTYAGRAERFVFSPGTRYSPTDLFTEFKDVMPGDSITQYIDVQNKRSNGVKVKMYIRALGAHKDSEEFLSQMNLRVEDVRGTHMFDAPASQKAQMSGWTYLGTLYSGGSTQLAVTLEVPVEMDNRFQNAVGYLDWEFMVEEFPVEPSDPKTGDTIMYYVAIMLASGTLLLFLLLAYRKKKKN